MSGFEVLNGGILASIQDLGRFGLNEIGVSEAGVLDEYSFNLLNQILQNDYGTNALEIVFGGVKLKCKGNTHFALTGASVDVSVNNKKVEMYKTHALKDGDVLTIGFATSGARVYLGVKGGFEVEKEFNSSSVSIKEGIGGRVIKPKDFLKFSTCKQNYNIVLKEKYRLKFDKVIELRMVSAYQWDKFEEKEREKFFNSTYEVTSQNDRMGFRLSGEKITSTCNGIISEGIAFGAVQIPAHGEPIVLLKERQTIGGYPKIGSVIRVDCFKLAQAKQGDKIRFKLVSLEEARESCKKFNNFFSEIVI
ncbi:biotin-dependent carboxyltransferase family protein [Sulfurospirillum sp. 1307]|jgi:biotin-dependent carboxylase-like uncharacterized protein